VDDPENQATEFEDLAELVPVPPAAAGTTISISTTPTRPDTDEVPTAEPEPPRRKRRLAGFLGGLGVLAVLLLAFVITAAWARRGYFVAFNDDGAVVIYRGQPDGFLWFEPTEEAPTVFTRIQLDEDSITRIDRRPEFSSRSNADEFVAEQLQTTTTSTTTTTTTTTAPATTTTAPTTTVAP
jgi:hypothetical protein